MLFIPNSSKLWLCFAPRNKCELSPPLPPSQAAGDIAPPAPGDGRGKSPTRKHPEGIAGDGPTCFLRVSRMLNLEMGQRQVFVNTL